MSTVKEQYTPIIAIDFDGTVVEHDFPNIGNLMPDAKRVINKWHDLGYYILIWTCRNNFEPDHHTDPDWVNAPIGQVVKFLKGMDVRFHGVNQQQPGLGFYLESRKIFANVYIDDRNMGGFPGWNAAERMVEEYMKSGNWILYENRTAQLAMKQKIDEI